MRSRGRYPIWAACWVTRERAGDDRLGGDDRRGGGQDHHRDPRPPGHQQEEGVADRVGGIGQDQGALPQVIEDAGGEDQEQPRPGDRAAAEVPHVGVQGLGAGHREHHGRQREERRAEVPEQERGRVRGGQRLEDRRVADDAADAQGGDHREPDAPSPARTAARPRRCRAAAITNRPMRIAAVIGSTMSPTRRRRDLHALDRGQHRDRRGDHAVAEEQRRAEHPEQRRAPAPSAARSARRAGGSA